MTIASRRLRGGADETTQTEIDRVVSDEIQDIDCLAAHSPIHMFAKYLDSFRPFTILRDPVDSNVAIPVLQKQALQ